MEISTLQSSKMVSCGLHLLEVSFPKSPITLVDKFDEGEIIKTAQITQIACTKFDMMLIITIPSTKTSTERNLLFMLNNSSIPAIKKNGSVLKLVLRTFIAEHIKKVVCGDNHIVYLIAGSQIPDHKRSMGIW